MRESLANAPTTPRTYSLSREYCAGSCKAAAPGLCTQPELCTPGIGGCCGPSLGKRVPAGIEQNKNRTDFMPGRDGQKSIDPLPEAGGVLLPQQIVQKHPHGIHAQALRPAQFPVNLLRVEGGRCHISSSLIALAGIKLLPTGQGCGGTRYRPFLPTSAACPRATGWTMPASEAGLCRSIASRPPPLTRNFYASETIFPLWNAMV